MMKETKKKKKSRDVRAHIGAFFRNKKAVTVTAILLAACLLLGTLLALFLPAGAVCYRYGGRAMREEVYRKIQELSLSGLNKRSAGELIQRVSGDTEELREFIRCGAKKLVSYQREDGYLGTYKNSKLVFSKKRGVC